LCIDVQNKAALFDYSEFLVYKLRCAYFRLSSETENFFVAFFILLETMSTFQIFV